RGAEREHRGTGQEMIERLFFDRIDAEPGRAPVGLEHDLIVFARAHEAQTALAFTEPAVARANVALHAPVGEHLPVAGRNRVAHGCSRRLNDFPYRWFLLSPGAANPPTARPPRSPAVAGTFYPSSPDALDRVVRSALASAHVDHAAAKAIV